MPINNVRLFILLIIFIKKIHAENIYYRYCNRNCPEFGTHTVCKRIDDDCGPAVECGKVLKPFMTNDIRQKVLDLHNEIRNRAGMGIEEDTAAADMNVLNYNFELEHIAQCWSNACMNKKDRCRLGMELLVGQNMGQTNEGKEEDIKNHTKCLTIIDQWAEGIKSFDYAQIDNYTGGETSGNSSVNTYTQIIWGNLEYIGCGRTIWAESSGRFVMNFVCNYGGMKSGGNVFGEPIYTKVKRDKKQSKCPNDVKNDMYDALCGNVMYVYEMNPGTSLRGPLSKFLHAILVTIIWYFITKVLVLI